MNGPLATLSIDRPCNEVRSAVRQALALAGLRSLETFDLQAARLRTSDCLCPRHGLARCNCQMVVLLVYGASVSPATLILHGSDGRTWLSMPDESAQPPGALTIAVQQALLDLPAASGL